MKRMFAVFVFAAASLAAQIGEQMSGVSISITNGEKSGYQFVLRNESAKVVSYAGYGGENSDQPVYRLEIFQDGKWVDRSPGWCGLGMGPCDLAPKSTRAFPIDGIYHASKEGQMFRVSVRFSAGAKSAWGKNGAPVSILSNEEVFTFPQKG